MKKLRVFKCKLTNKWWVVKTLDEKYNGDLGGFGSFDSVKLFVWNYIKVQQEINPEALSFHLR